MHASNLGRPKNKQKWSGHYLDIADSFLWPLKSKYFEGGYPIGFLAEVSIKEDAEVNKNLEGYKYGHACWHFLSFPLP